eukprot:scaffold57789_cov36-Phaeocystis_antarctica.AAC.1
MHTTLSLRKPFPYAHACTHPLIGPHHLGALRRTTAGVRAPVPCVLFLIYNIISLIQAPKITPAMQPGGVRGMPGAPFGSTGKSASSHTQHPTRHVAIMATILSSPVNNRFAAGSTARQQDRLTQRAHTSGGLVHARHGAFQELTTGA